MASHPRTKFAVEVTRLRRLYVAVRHAFREMSSTMATAISRGNLDKNHRVTTVTDNGALELRSTAFGLIRNLEVQFPRYLCDALLVRAISALEVFLIDSIRTVFLVRRDLFHSDQRIELTHAELLSADNITELWARIINRELRRLQNQGFREIVKYYRTKLKIDFGNSPLPLEYLEKLHIKRHLLVHALGATDAEYRHKYNTAESQVRIDEPILLECFERFYVLADFVQTECNRLIAERKINRAGVRAIATVRVELEPVSSDVAVLDRDYMFGSGDDITRVADILRQRFIENGRHVLVISGHQPRVAEYLEILRTEARRGLLAISDVTQLALVNDRRRASSLPLEQLREIARNLPPLPLPKGIHHEIATRLGISNTQASLAINTILADDELRELINSREETV